MIAAFILAGCIPNTIPSLSGPAGSSNSAVPAVSFLQANPTASTYPGPADTTLTAEAYPGPGSATMTSFPNPYTGPTTTPAGYPGLASPTPPKTTPGQGPSRTPTIVTAGTQVPGLTSSPGPGVTVSPELNVTPSPELTITPTQHPLYTSQPPQNVFQTVTIWHSWNPTETQTLEEVIRSFQSIFSNVKFVLTYFPPAELQEKYARSAYLGDGPDLLLGPADWGPAYYDQELVADLAQVADAKFLATINPAALNEARYRGALIGLPYTIRSGIVMIRNKTILPYAPASFDELVTISKAATHGGVVGAYLEWSFFYAAAHLDGIGGQLMDQNGDPAFNSAMGVEWLKLLNAFREAGPTEFNGSHDLDTFKTGNAGLIIDGTWNLPQLAQAIGAQNLVVDPWPAYKTGHLAGYIQTDNIYLNSNVTGDQRYAALQFMGFFLAGEVQSMMTRAGHIPAVMDINVTDPLMQQEMTAFKGAVAYPIRPELQAYWDPLQAAMLSVVNNRVDPAPALQQAYQDTQAAIVKIRAEH